MRLGIRDAAVEVVNVDELQNLLQHLLRSFVQAVDVVAVPHDEDEVCNVAQYRVRSECFDECDDVLLCIRPAQCQHDWLVRVAQEAVYL